MENSSEIYDNPFGLQIFFFKASHLEFYWR